MKKLILFICMVFLCLYINAEDEFIQGKIKGIILDSQTKQPMEYANIGIYNKSDSTLISGGISNINGIFEISKLKYGEYYIMAGFIGYDKLYIDNIKLLQSEPITDVGEIILTVSTNNLEDINIIVERQRIEYKIDKKVINVGQDINAIGGTAIDILENTPSVEVDIEGNVSLRGSSNFMVLIDGKPSVLSGSDALRQIPSSTIQNIEIITNPSVKYDTDSSAGIINIIMKKNILSGFNGILNTTISNSDKYRSDLTLNYRTKNINLFFGTDWSDDNSWSKMYSERENILKDTTVFIISDGTRYINRNGFNIKGGVDFFISNNTTLSLSSTIGNMNFNMDGYSNLHQYTIPEINNTYTKNLNLSERGGNTFNINLSAQQKFNESGTHKLDFLAYYSNRKGDDFENQDEYISDAFYNTQQTIEKIRTFSNDNSNNYRFKLDYVNTINEKSNIEAGIQSILEHDKENYNFENYNTDLNLWIDNSQFSSNMDFKNDVYAAYITFSSKIGDNLSYMTGLRTEYTDRYIKNDKSIEASTIKKIDLFPSLHLSYNLFKNSQLMTSYSQRIRRPDGRDLDPFMSYIDQYTIRMGNPDLKPEYTNSYELQFLQRFNQSFLSFDIFYKTTNDLITRIQKLNNDGIIYMTSDNINNDSSLGTEIMGNININKSINLNTSFSVYNYKIEGEINNNDISRSSTNYSIRNNITYKISDNSRLQLMSMYRGPSVSAQGKMSSMFFSNISYRQDFLKDKLTATVSVRDLFGTMKMENITYGENFKFSNKMSREPRIFQLTLSYNLNNYKTERSSEINTENMEIEY